MELNGVLKTVIEDFAQGGPYCIAQWNWASLPMGFSTSVTRQG